MRGVLASPVSPVYDGLEVGVTLLADVRVACCRLLLPRELLSHPSARDDRHHQLRLAEPHLQSEAVTDARVAWRRTAVRGNPRGRAQGRFCYCFCYCCYCWCRRCISRSEIRRFKHRVIFGVKRQDGVFFERRVCISGYCSTGESASMTMISLQSTPPLPAPE